MTTSNPMFWFTFLLLVALIVWHIKFVWGILSVNDPWWRTYYINLFLKSLEFNAIVIICYVVVIASMVTTWYLKI